MTPKTRNHLIKKDRSLMATGIVIIIIILLMITAYLRINTVLQQRSLSRMEEGVNTVIEEITAKLNRESRILNATAQIISQADNFDISATQEIMRYAAPLLETMRVMVLLPDDRILSPDGNITDASDSDSISFKDEAPLGEHISSRVYNLSDGSPILRHYVPIVQDGQVAAILYGVTRLDTLEKSLNINNIYNASANVYIVDTKSGDFILDTLHETLGNMKDYELEDGRRQTKGSLTWDQYTEDLLNLGTGYVIFRSPETDDWEYLYYAPANNNQWAIAVSVPEKEAFTSVFEVRTVCIYLSIVMAIVILLYYLWVRHNSRRVMEQAVEQAVLTEKLQKAEAADRAKSTFLSNMSHDIRTPMNAIIGFTTLAQTTLDNRERTQEYLSKILSSSNHLLSLINDILDMSRIESGKLNIEEKECSISDIFRDMRNIIQTQMASKQLNFFMDTIDVIDEDIYCDKLHVNQILLNLLSNAIKFTPSGGTVALTIRQKGRAPKGYGSYEISIKDTGIGMSEEFTKHIFEPFERERSSTASGIQGTGLGMAITKNIVDTMGGTIELHSEQGKGTEFIINLDFRLQTEQKKVEVIRELQGLHALVVDDSFTTCDNVTKMLQQIGMRSEWVLHGKEAVLHAKHAYEIGDEYHAYIIVVTAYDWTPFEEEAKAAGVTAFCNKPIFLSELRDILVSATSHTEEPQSQALQTIPDVSDSLRGARLLLVEDNELNREIAQELLSGSGFLVETAANGSIAVDMISQSSPGYYSLVLMDIQMPVMDGYDATREIRRLADPALANIPIVAMTANAFDEDRKRALECGMNAHISKPIDVNNLLEVLTDILSQKPTA